MIFTIEEAASRSCCQFKNDHAGIACEASDCMAWRWFDTLTDDGTACDWKPTAMVRRHPDDTKQKPLDQRRGYCGLAGKP